MPHTSKKDQEAVIANNGIAITVGDLCREEFVPMVRAFKANPRWTTIHKQLKGTFGLTDGQTAKILAFIEFYRLYGADYENLKMAENGRAE